MSPDQAYDNRAAVPEFPEFLVGWQKASDFARQTARAFSRHAYLSGQTFDPSELCRPPANGLWGTDRCQIDFFAATVCGPRPLLIFIHGGYWRSLGPEVFHFLAPAWTDQDIHVAFLGYDLCPSVGIDHIAAQCRAGLRWLWQFAPDLKVDRQRMVVAGHSAGGHLAAMAVSEPNHSAGDSGQASGARAGGLGPVPQLAGCISLSGIFDLEPLALTSMNTDLRIDGAVAMASSPIYRQPNPEILQDGRLALFVGAAELPGFHQQHAALIQAWQLQGRAGLHCPQGLHHFSIVNSLIQPGSAVFKAATRLLRPQVLHS